MLSIFEGIQEKSDIVYRRTKELQQTYQTSFKPGNSGEEFLKHQKKKKSQTKFFHTMKLSFKSDKEI